MELRVGGYARVLIDAIDSNNTPLKGLVGEILWVATFEHPETGNTYKKYYLNFGGDIGEVGWFPMEKIATIEAVPKAEFTKQQAIATKGGDSHRS